MTLYGFNFSYIELIFLMIMFIASVYLLYFYIRFIGGALRYKQKADKGKISFASGQPPVSVIIAAKNEEENLIRFLPKVLEQNYPEFEVIVVDDASTDNTDMVFKQLKEKYPNFRTSFVPPGTKNISSKKLAVTLGIKAAKYDLLLFTDADCFPENENWIAHMVRNFTPETEFVLGYGPYMKEKGFLNHLITYDTLFIALQYLGMAIEGKPYMGVGRNLAYRKETFFNLKGFSSHLDILSGDDDLLVNKGCSKSNTRIEIARESLTWSEPKKTFREWYYQKRRHLSSSVKYKKSTKLQLAVEPVTRGLFYLSFILILILGNPVTVIAGVLFYIIRTTVLALILNRSAALFDTRRYYVSLMILDILLPLVSLITMLAGKPGSSDMKWK